MKIKLRDMTFEQYDEWQAKKCGDCENCIFKNVKCYLLHDNVWINHKDLYSDKFLDQEIEIKDEPLIDKQTQDYLEKINKDYDVTHVRKGSDYIRFFADIDGEWEINFYCSKKAKIYNDFRNLETGKDYLIKDLIQSKNDILTLEERKYLRAVIKPFRDNVESIEKIGSEYLDSDNDFVVIHLVEDSISLPILNTSFKFNGMELNKQYTLKELRL